MKTFIGDFHVHTLLSPCAEVEMTPHHIVMRAAQYGISMLAITDHNASGNILAALEAGQKYGVKVLPGMEVECAEEAHIVVIFDTWEQMTGWQKIIDQARSTLPPNNEKKFGKQFVVDAEDNFIREEKRMLFGACQLKATDVINQSKSRGALVFAAHVDRPSYSLLGQLGFIGEDLQVDAVEISRQSIGELKEKKLKSLVGNRPYMTNSDGHTILDFIQGPKNILELKEPSIEEIKLALAGKDGRKFTPGYFIKEM